MLQVPDDLHRAGERAQGRLGLLGPVEKRVQEPVIERQVPGCGGVQNLARAECIQVIGIGKQLWLLLGFDDDVDIDRNVAMKTHRHSVLADRTDWLVQLNFAALDVVLLCFERIGDVLRGD